MQGGYRRESEDLWRRGEHCLLWRHFFIFFQVKIFEWYLIFFVIISKRPKKTTKNNVSIFFEVARVSGARGQPWEKWIQMGIRRLVEKGSA